MRRVSYVIREDSEQPPRWFTGECQQMFPFPAFDARRKYALQYRDKQLATLKARRLCEQGFVAFVEEW